MAKRRTATVRKQGGVVVVSQPAPVARRRSTRRAVAKVRRGARRVSAAYGQMSIQKRMTGVAVGGFGVGMLEKMLGAKIPSLPYVGRKGAIALGIYLLKPKSALLQDVGIAAAAIAGYEFGSTGKVTGAHDEWYATT